MTETPKLTVGIPTLDRADYLHTAIDSALAQTLPVHIIVADQGHTDEVAAVMRRYSDHPRVEHVRSEATCLAENWECAARHCDTPFFLWLQDDDTMARGVAARIVAGFARFPEALHWQARLCTGVSPTAMAWWGHCGPWVLMDMLNGLPAQWPGSILIPSMYFTSWSLSPGVAFRCGEAFNRTLDFLPHDADLLQERLVLASMGSQGPWIADPVLAGPWVHHGGNESYKQHADQARQTEVMIEHLDRLMDGSDWEQIFGEWCGMLNAMQVLGWVENFPADQSRHADRLRAVMATSLSGRIKAVGPPGSVQDSAPADRHAELIWTGADCGTNCTDPCTSTAASVCP